MSEDKKFIGKLFTIENASNKDKQINFICYETTTGNDQTELDELSKKMKDNDDALKYLDSQGKYFNENSTTGYTTIEVLPELKGLELTNLTIAYLHALRPSKIRITYGETTCDVCTWRVTVYIDKSNIIEKIEQEVKIGYGCGSDISQCLEEAKTGRKPYDSNCYMSIEVIKKVDL
jgi:hypothetical protein